jgi:hypothetical protein
MIIILLGTLEERWRCTLEAVWITATLHSGYRYRSVTDHTAAIDKHVDHDSDPISDDCDSDDVLMAKTVQSLSCLE